ncbi:hypothetical protein V8F20_006892 [Naviculisporaceae sp. PSN 640]
MLKFDEFIAVLTAKRRPNQELNPFEHTVICSLVTTGKSQREVSRLFRISHTTITNTLRH